MDKLLLLIGTYTSLNCSVGMYTYEFNQDLGSSTYLGVTELENPSYAASGSNKNNLYVITEKFGKQGMVSAYQVDNDKKNLSTLNNIEISGIEPCYIAVDKEGTIAVTANYGNGTISVIEILKSGKIGQEVQSFEFDGKGNHPTRQTGSHIHCVVFTPDQKYLLATDLGADKIYQFEVIEDNGAKRLRKLSSEISLNTGSVGPRHLKFHPNGKYLYLINELSGTITSFNYNAQENQFVMNQTILADKVEAEGSADIHISPDGNFLYTSHRILNDGISIYSINHENGHLSEVGYMKTMKHPRNFIITPNGKYLLVACKDSNVVEVYTIDNKTGLLSKTENNIYHDRPVFLFLM